MLVLIFFILLLIIAIILYMYGQKVSSTIIFFFFLFDSFQLIPEKVIGLKTLDLAIIYILFLFIWGLCKYKDYIPRNKSTLIIGLFLTFIFFEMLLSHFHYGISWSEIIRTGRQHLLLLSYFVFRRLDKEEINQSLKILFVVVIIQSFLFIIQAFTGVGILNNSELFFKKGNLFRFYNISLMHYFFVFYAIFCNPFKSFYKWSTMIIAIITIFLPMHRSLNMAFILLFVLGILWVNHVFNSVKRTIILLCCLFVLITTVSTYISIRTMEDINKVAAGDYQELEDVKLSSESTFLFRVAHFYERYTTMLEDNVGKWLGLGFMTEGSPYTEAHFDFMIGLENEDGGIDQIDTPDISWSIFVIRYGIIGTILFLILYFYFIVYYFRYQSHGTICIVMILYLLLIFTTSLTSDLLYKINMLIFPLIYIDQWEDPPKNKMIQKNIDNDIFK